MQERYRGATCQMRPQYFQASLILLLISFSKAVEGEATGCTGQSGGAWAEGICTIDANGARSSSCKPCLVGDEWDALRAKLGTQYVAGKRNSMINVGVANWNSATMLYSVFRIIAEELLGYSNIVSIANGGEMTEETANPDCKAIFLEAWNGGSDMELQRRLIEDDRIILTNYLGAAGHETLYVPAYMPFISSHYRSLHENIVQLMPDGKLVEAMDNFVRDGTVGIANLTEFFDTDAYGCDAINTASWNVSQCVAGRWYPERCGTTFPSSHCAEAYIPNAVWSSGIFESAIDNLGLNFSVVYTGYDGLLEVVKERHEQQAGMVYYWWEPDPLHVRYPSAKLILPPNSPECEDKYHPDPLLSGSDCDMGKLLLRKFIHTDLRNSEPDLYNLWEKFQFSTEEIYEIMALQKAGGGPFGFEDAACEFLKSDSSVNWQSWLSITDFCSSNGPNYEWQEDLKKCTALVDRASCIPGQFFDAEEESCKQCPPGHFTDASGLTECFPCPAGSTCSEEGCPKCTLCPASTYSDVPAALSCVTCPRNTHTYTLEGADAIGRCACPEGFYRRDGRSGAECYPCPEGGRCLGGVFLPHAQPGYWGDWAMVVAEGLPDSKEASVAVSTQLFHSCTQPASCNGCFGPEAELLGDDAIHECRMEQSNICTAAYAGVMCHSCAPEHFSIQGQCMACPPMGWLFTLSCLALIVALWYIINRVVANEYDAVDLLLLYFQNASTVSTFTLGWSKLLVTVPFLVLAIVNFDVTYMSWDCLLPMQHSPVLSYGFGFVLQLALPVILAAVNYAHYRLLRMFSRLGVFKGSLEEVADNAVASTGAFANLVIHTVTFKCLEPMMCIQMPGQLSVLRAAPGIPCWESNHIPFVVVGFLGLLFYTVGVPVACVAILNYGAKHNLLRTTRFQRRWGWLYLRYERDWFYWELLIMGRRCLLVGVSVVAAMEPASIQVVLGAGICVTAMTVHFYARPFIDEGLDRLEMFSLISLMVIIFTGVLFSDDAGRLRFSSWDTVATALTLLAILGCIVLAATMVYQNVRERTAIRTVSRRMRRALHHALHAHCGGGTGSQSKMSKMSKMNVLNVVKAAVGKRHANVGEHWGDAVSASGEIVPDGGDGIQAEIRALLDAEELELHETLDVHQIVRWMENLSIKGVTLAQSMRSIMGSARSLSPSLSNSEVEPATQVSHRRGSQAMLDSAAFDSHSQHGVLRFWLANHWLAALMSDSSPVSCYSSRNFSRFFANLIQQNPFLIDHLLFSSGEELVRAKAAVNDLREAQVFHTTQGRLAPMVSEKDRGSFLAWLTIADEFQIEVVRNLMVDIYRNSHDGAHPLNDSNDPSWRQQMAAPLNHEDAEQPRGTSMFSSAMKLSAATVAPAPQCDKGGGDGDGEAGHKDDDSIQAEPAGAHASSTATASAEAKMTRSETAQVSGMRKMICRSQLSRLDAELRAMANGGSELEDYLRSKLGQ